MKVEFMLSSVSVVFFLLRKKPCRDVRRNCFCFAVLSRNVV